MPNSAMVMFRLRVDYCAIFFYTPYLYCERLLGLLVWVLCVLLELFGFRQSLCSAAVFVCAVAGGVCAKP